MLAQLKFFKHVWVLMEIVGMVSFELGEELRRMFFRLVTSQRRPASVSSVTHRLVYNKNDTD